MDESLGMESELEILTPEVEETFSKYLDNWKRLVSTTNWDKGRIICEWRQALIDAGAPAPGYSDEAWSRRVGNVTGQHVGRLRRVNERFADSRQTYEGLYWSHFQAALDWNDAEMWLEGAVQKGWSVARMRDQRWESMGAPEDKKPHEEDIITAEFNEDVDPADDSPPDTILDSSAQVQPADEEPSFGDEPVDAADQASFEIDEPPINADQPMADPVRPFDGLPAMPDDMNEAFEQFKLTIVNQRVAGWKDISSDGVLTVLDALRELVLAPPES